MNNTYLSINMLIIINKNTIMKLRNYFNLNSVWQNNFCIKRFNLLRKTFKNHKCMLKTYDIKKFKYLILLNHNANLAFAVWYHFKKIIL